MNSKWKSVVEIEVPELLREMPDGTVAKEMMTRDRFVCPHCNGSGKVLEEDGHGALVKRQCDVCLGYGELTAVVTVEWKPCVRRDAPGVTYHQG